MKVEEGYDRVESVKGWVAILLLAFTVTLSLYMIRPPEAVDESLSPSQFSSSRALEHVRAIASEPRPVGSAAHDAARDYILNELLSLGVDSEVQKTTGIRTLQSDSAIAATVENVVGRIEGSEGGRAVMLTAHYDTVPNSYGASDDAAAVAALLEVARTLKSGPPLKYDIILLFTDCEECGLLGAEAFVNSHPWAKQVELVGNFEARGNSGPVYLFETTQGSTPLIERFSESANPLFANSLMPELYRLLPNDTDFTIFREAGWAGFNFAYIDGSTRYHTLLDSYRELDERSLQHQGQYALALARLFGDGELSVERQFDAIYFDVLGRKFFSYPKRWMLPLMVAVYVLVGAIVLLGMKRKRLKLSGLALGLVSFTANAVIVLITVSLTWSFIVGLDAEAARAHAGEPYNASFYLAGLILLACSITLTQSFFLAKRVGFPHMFVGALLFWTALMTLSGLFLDGGSYIFTLPIFFMLAGVGIVLANGVGVERFTTNEVLLLSLCVVPGVVLIAPLVKTIHAGLGLNQTAIVFIPLVLLFGLFLPAFDFLLRALVWRLPASLLVVSVTLLVAGGLYTRFDDRHPEPDSVFYVLDPERSRAIWMSLHAQPSTWTGKFFPPGAVSSSVNDYLPNFLGPFLNAPAPVVSLVPPSAEIVSDESSAGVRRLRLRITSPRNASIITVGAEAGTQILSASVNDRRLSLDHRSTRSETQGVWTLEYYAPDQKGFELMLEVDPAKPLKMRIFDISYGLPSVPEQPIGTRPANSMPMPDGSFFQDTTIVTKSFSFGQIGS